MIDRTENIGGIMMVEWSGSWGCRDWGWWWPRIATGEKWRGGVFALEMVGGGGVAIEIVGGGV